MRPRDALASLWRWLGHVGTAAWLWSVGGGAVLGALLRALTTLTWPWIALLGFGIACIILALILRYREQRTRAPETPTRRKTPGRAARNLIDEIARVDWDAQCRPVSESLGGAFGRGVRLAIEGRQGEQRDLRCIVTGPDGTRYRSVRRVTGFGSGPSSREAFHWPGEFEPKPGTPWTPGNYSYSWSGDTGSIEDNRSEVLARRFFYVDEDETIACHGEVARPTGSIFADDFRRAQMEGVAVEVRLLSGERLFKGVQDVDEQEGSVTLYDPQVMGDTKTVRKVRLDQVASVTITDVSW
jgi:hypothetical protein